MKIRCDVCDKEEASMFCCADEAALCNCCDQRVHHANKLASKHSRFSLLHPTFKQSPICDICQERRAFLFCQEDRAILCRECDFPIHKANEQTQKHNRFLLTGVKLSATPSLYSASSSSSSSEPVLNISTQSSTKRHKTVSNNNEILSFPPIEKTVQSAGSENRSYSTSSISEYLMETLPGWQVDDFLDPSFASNGFCKTQEIFPKLPFVNDIDDLGRNTNSFSPEDLAFWVPQIDVFDTAKDQEKAYHHMVFEPNWDDNFFTVPQISPPSFKKTRHFH